ncbi:MAG: hypothetical protein IJC01_04345 [Clostridia bacterium]|nr:hypothetical protein [Clostridia bacterium]
MKNKTRKSKKILMVAAIALMVALVAAMGTMTYSRYITTTSEPTQTATAAKWGYVLNADAANIFGDTYKKDGATATVDATGTIVVQGQAGVDIVAPGTSGSMAISISGSSEVLAQFKISITGTDIKYDDYLPIVWTFNGNNYNSISALNTAMESGGAALKATWDAGQNAFVFSAASYELSWAWDFGTAAETSAKDTLIGYKAAGKAWAEIKDLTCATGAAYSAFVTGGDDAADEAIYEAIEHQLSFTLTATIEQIQG